MQPRLLTLVLASLAVAALLVAAPTPARSVKKSEPVAGELIVGFVAGLTEAQRDDALSKAGAKAAKKLGKAATKLARTDPANVAHALKVLSADPRVRYAEPNVRVSLAAVTPNDPSFGQLWGLKNTGQTVNGVTGTADADIDADEAWSVTTGSRSVIVAVVDTGVDFSHPDLGGSSTASPLMWTNPGESCSGCKTDHVDNDGNGYVDDWRGWDFANNDNNPVDDNDHGSHVAGTIGAQGGNGVGVTGVNWNVTVMALKFLKGNGTGTVADAVEALRYAASFGVPITNNSWIDTVYSQALADVVAEEQDMLIVAAAGNDGFDIDVTPYYPAALEGTNVVAVAATTQTDGRASFSNYGDVSVDLGAPGSNILSTVPGGYAYFDGTSMASPHVAGVAALAKSAFPGATAAGLKALLLGTVDPVGSMVNRTTTGGRLNAANAVSCADEGQVLIDEPLPGFLAAVGQPTEVTLIGAACGEPGAAVSAVANGEPVALTPRGDGVYTGTFAPGAAGPVTLQATATGAGGSDTATAIGSAISDYRVADAPFAWIDPTVGGTLLPLNDDTSATVALPFSFPFYGTAYSSLKVSSNGYVVFGSSTATQYVNAPIPSTSAPNGFAAPFWDDLDPGAAGDVWHRTVGTAPNRQFVVGWIGVARFGGGNATLELVLEEATGAIVFQYQDVTFGNAADNGGSATVGVEHGGGVLGEQFSYNTPALAGYPNATALRFTLDGAAPETTITSGPSGTVVADDATFAFTSSEPGSTFACSLDGSALASCSSPVSYTALAQGAHTFRVRATDAGGNVDPTPAERSWTIQAAACGLTAGVLDLTLAPGESPVIGRAGSSIEVTGIGLADETCGGATVSNVDTISVHGAAGDETVTFDLAGGPLGPGATPEGAGTSEIEIAVSLGTGTDTLAVLGTTAGNKIRLGVAGVDLNWDGDPDVTSAAVEAYRVDAGGGGDTVLASGGSGTGGRLAEPVVLIGGTGADKLTGGNGDDSLDGGPDIDTLDGGTGADVLAGGTATDTALYTSRTSAVAVTLDDLPNDGGAGEGDDVRSDIENVKGGSGGDTLIGSAANNALTGAAGDDTIDGGGGTDTLTPGDGADVVIGGDGTDTVVFAGTAAVSVSLDGIANDGVAGEDDVRTDVERITGAGGGDTLNGNAAVNILKGLGGADVLDAAGGKDTVDGGEGADQIDAVDGAVDTVKCGPGVDTVTADVTDKVNADCENVTRV